jgi:hypothetical protein
MCDNTDRLLCADYSPTAKVIVALDRTNELCNCGFAVLTATARYPFGSAKHDNLFSFYSKTEETVNYID